MSIERARSDRFRAHPLPLTWELPVLVAAAALLLALLTPLVLQGLVIALRGGEYAWPDDTLPALGAVLRGDFGIGLAPREGRLLVGPGWMRTITILGEAAVLGSLWVVVHWCRELLGRGAEHGLATAGQAAAALGLGALRQKAPVVRPDLFADTSPWARRRWRWSRHRTITATGRREPR